MQFQGVSTFSIIMPNLTVLGQTVRAYLWRPAKKEWTPCVRPDFQGHSRSSEAICINRLLLTSY